MCAHSQSARAHVIRRSILISFALCLVFTIGLAGPATVRAAKPTAHSKHARRHAPKTRKTPGSPTSIQAPGPYPDVPARHWAANAIQNLTQRKILVGDRTRNYEGEKPVTRYELAVALYRMVKYLDELRGDTPPAHTGAPASTGNGKRTDAGAGPALEGRLPADVSGWLIQHSYLPGDTILARAPGSATVSPSLLSDCLAYVADRIILHRGTKEEQPTDDAGE